MLFTGTPCIMGPDEGENANTCIKLDGLQGPPGGKGEKGETGLRAVFDQLLNMFAKNLKYYNIQRKFTVVSIYFSWWQVMLKTSLYPYHLNNEYIAYLYCPLTLSCDVGDRQTGLWRWLRYISW